METRQTETPFAGPFLARDFAELTGLTYRQLDYYVRHGILRPVQPARGSGTRRLFDVDDVARARLAGALMRLGAGTTVVALVLAQLDRDPERWPEYFFVEPCGRLHIGLPLPDACWWVSKPALLHPKREAVAA